MWDIDNVIFNVNGKGEQRLKEVLFIALGLSRIEGWKFIKEKGMILYSYADEVKGINKFPSPLTWDAIAPMVFQWLQGEEAKQVPCEGWDNDEPHDGSNERGWRVYTEDWGLIEGKTALAIKPAYVWHGK